MVPPLGDAEYEAQWWGGQAPQTPQEHMIILVPADQQQCGNFQPWGPQQLWPYPGVVWTPDAMGAPGQLPAMQPATAAPPSTAAPVPTLQALLKTVDTQAAPQTAPPVQPAQPPVQPAVQPAPPVPPVQSKTTWCDEPIDEVEDRTDLDTTTTPRDLVPTLEVEDGDPVALRYRPSSSAARRLRRKRASDRQRQAADPTPPQELDMTKLRRMLDRGDVTGVAKQMRGQVYMLSRHPVHCRMLQEVLEACSSQQAQVLAQELEGYVWELATCPHGNFTVQKVISHLSSAASEFVAWELRGYAVQAAKHTQACRILCRLLEFSGSGATWYLVEELMEVVDKLCTHKFAHHVIQSVLEHGEAEHRQRIADVLLLDGLRFATDKHCSYLIEKMLCYCSVADQEKLIDTLGTPQMLLELATTQYGSFVARALLRDDRVDYEGAMWSFKRHQKELEQSKYGLRFLSDLGLKSD